MSVDNLGKALALAGHVMLFVFAASTSIYLYGSLFSYLNVATEATGIEFRAENTIGGTTSGFKRPISVSEIYITLHNMEKMHISKLKVDSYEVTLDQVKNSKSEYANMIAHIKSVETKKFTYSVEKTSAGYTTVSYKKI